jgi:hypothetical protein
VSRTTSNCKLTEHQIQGQILDWLAQKHIFHFRNNSGMMRMAYKGKPRFIRFGAVGSPDIFAIHGGRIYGIEVKRPGRKFSEAQMQFGADLELAGGVYCMAFSLYDVTRCMEESRMIPRG